MAKLMRGDIETVVGRDIPRSRLARRARPKAGVISARDRRIVGKQG